MLVRFFLRQALGFLALLGVFRFGDLAGFLKLSLAPIEFNRRFRLGFRFNRRGRLFHSRRFFSDLLFVFRALFERASACRLFFRGQLARF